VISSVSEVPAVYLQDKSNLYSSNIISVFKARTIAGRAMAQAVSRRLVGFVVEKVALGQVPPHPEYLGFSPIHSLHRCSITRKKEKS
jgi:hypothetical protein